MERIDLISDSTIATYFEAYTDPVAALHKASHGLLKLGQAEAEAFRVARHHKNQYEELAATCLLAFDQNTPKSNKETREASILNDPGCCQQRRYVIEAESNHRRIRNAMDALSAHHASLVQESARERKSAL